MNPLLDRIKEILSDLGAETFGGRRVVFGARDTDGVIVIFSRWAEDVRRFQHIANTKVDFSAFADLPKHALIGRVQDARYYLIGRLHVQFCPNTDNTEPRRAYEAKLPRTGTPRLTPAEDIEIKTP